MAVSRKRTKRGTPGKDTSSSRNPAKDRQAAASRAKAAHDLEDLARFPQENPSPVLRVNRDGSIKYANSACNLLDFKCQPGELLPEQYRQVVTDVLKTGVYLEIQTGGKERIFTLDFVPVTDKEYVNIYGRDITEREQVQEALQKARDELEIRVEERTRELSTANARLRKEIEERTRTEQSLRLEQARLDALLYLSQMSEASVDETAAYVLEQGIKLTQSKIGFVGFLSEDESVYTLHAVSKDVVKECQVEGNLMHWPVAEAGIWAEAIRERRTLFINDYSKSHLRKKGVPSGHPSINRLIVVPVFDGERIVVVAGMGNKDSDYDEDDEQQITLLLRGMWNHVQREHSRQELQQAHDELELKVEKRTRELHESQQDLNRAQAVAKTGSWRLDVQRNLLLWSEENHRIFGIPEGTAMTYETFLACVHPDDREYVDQKWQAALQGEEYDIEHRIIVGDEVRWVREKVGLEYDELGILKGGFGTTQDITERKEMEGAVKEEKDRLFAVINSIADEVWFADTQGNYTLENEAALHEFGISGSGTVNIEDMAQGLEVYRADGSRRPIEETPSLRAIQGETIRNVEEIVRTPATGDLRYRQISSSPVRDASGNIMGSVSVVRDITEKKRAEERIEELLRERSEQLEESQTNFQLLVDTMAEGVIVVDNSGYIKFANPAAAYIFNLTERKLLGHFFGVPSAEGITEIEAPAGNRNKTLQLNSVEITWGDQPGYLATLRDITQQKNAMERVRMLSRRLVEAQERERRDIGHELHDEVGGALTAIKLALSRVRNKTGDKAEQAFNEVTSLLDETMDLVSNLSQNMRPDILNEFGLVEALKWYFERYTSQTGIKINFKATRLKERYPMNVETTVYRIVQESLTNVARYAGVRQAEVSVRSDSKKLYLQVQDSGCGFDPEKIDATSSGISGMQDRAFLADGELVVDSSPGEGTCINCELPVTGT